MRVVCLSDTHTMHSKVTVPEGDILIHAGDFTSTGQPEEIAEFNRWLGTLPHKHKVVVAGNHDFLFERAPKVAWGLLSNAHYLEDSGICIEGLNIWGSPWTPAFGNWAFNLPRSGKEIRGKWEMIPNKIDVLVTHGPPLGRGDYLPERREYVGCSKLKRAVKRINPRLHVFGHIHEGYGRAGKFVNASICNAQYAPVNPPIVVEL